MKRFATRSFFLLLSLVLLLGACAAPASPPPPPTVTSTALPTATQPATRTPIPPPTQRATITPEASNTPPVTLTPARNPYGYDILFKTEDGVELAGHFYPAAVPNAPVVVMMHQFAANQGMWAESQLIPWLQNWPLPPGMNATPTQSAFGQLPLMPADMTFNVLTFDFRGHGKSGGLPTAFVHGDAQKWYLIDARTAYAAARQLEGVNPDIIIGFGTSIGADAVVDTCGDGCRGAFAISPGSHLGLDWVTAVDKMLKSGKQVRCMYAVNDYPSPLTCSSVENGPFYEYIGYSGKKHGMDFLVPRKMETSFGQVLLDFLTLAIQ